MTDTTVDTNVNVNPNDYKEPKISENIFMALVIIGILIYFFYLLKM